MITIHNRALAAALVALAALTVPVAVAQEGEPSQNVCVDEIQLPGCPPPDEPPPEPPPGGPPPECEFVKAPSAQRWVGLGGGDSLNASSAAERNCILSEQVKAGVGFLRQTFDWAQIERRKGKYDLRAYDQWVADAARHGMRVLPILFNPPRFRWAGPRRGTVHGTWRPKRASDLGRFGARLIRRYGPDGSLWRDPEFAGVPKRPITAWQIWNEPNLKVYWQPTASPTEYAKMMQVVYPMMKRADPKAEIISAGIPDSRFSNPNVWIWLERFYQEGGAKGIDSLAVHAYARTARLTFAKLHAIRDIMARYGDRRGGLWITEIGWATEGPKSDYTLREKQVAKEIRGLFYRFRTHRKALRLRGLTYYTWRDKEPYPPRYLDIWGLHAGLLRKDGRPKSTLDAFRGAARKFARLNG